MKQGLDNGVVGRVYGPVTDGPFPQIVAVVAFPRDLDSKMAGPRSYYWLSDHSLPPHFIPRRYGGVALS